MSDLRMCDQCEKFCVRARSLIDTFEYGRETATHAHLQAEVMVWSCEMCGFAYTEAEADDARQAAVERYLSGNV